MEFKYMKYLFKDKDDQEKKKLRSYNSMKIFRNDLISKTISQTSFAKPAEECVKVYANSEKLEK